MDPNYNLLKDIRPKGILVEPEPTAFSKLKRNYANNKRMKFENIAIGNDDDNNMIFYSFKNSKKSCLSKATAEIKKKIGAGDYIEIKIKTMKWSTLLKKHVVNLITMVHIDAEGYDHIIVNQILDYGILPSIIEYEDNLLY